MRRVLFYSSEGFDSIQYQQYSLNDIEILKQLGYEVEYFSSFSWKMLFCKYEFFFCWWVSGSILPVLVSKFTKTPSIVISGGNEAISYFDSVTNLPRGYSAYNFVKRFLVRLSLKYATHVLPVSNFVKDANLKIHLRDYTVVYNAIRTNQFSSSFVSCDERRAISMVSNFNFDAVSIKRVYPFLSSTDFFDFSNDNYFEILGKDGSEYSRVLSYVSDLKNKDYIRLSKAVSNSEMSLFYSRVAVYCQISDTETFGMSVAEALASGCKLVLSCRGALPEIYSHVASFCDHNDPFSIYSSICFQLQNNLHDSHVRSFVLSFISFDMRKTKLNSIFESLNL